MLCCSIQQGVIVISSTMSKTAEKKMAQTEGDKKTKKSADKSVAASSSSGGKHDVDASKFANYFDFHIEAARIKPHQVMALNRGEEVKCLTVRLTVPEDAKQRVLAACERKWLTHAQPPDNKSIIRAGIVDGYNRLVEPHMTRHQWCVYCTLHVVVVQG